jgi:hypothetical protein
MVSGKHSNRSARGVDIPPTSRNLVFRTRTNVREYVSQRMRVRPTVTHTVGVRFAQRTGVPSCSRATGVRLAHWMCVWSYSRLWWHLSTSRNERQTVASEQPLDVPSV